jgi:hypothetical protein
MHRGLGYIEIPTCLEMTLTHRLTSVDISDFWSLISDRNDIHNYETITPNMSAHSRNIEITGRNFVAIPGGNSAATVRNSGTIKAATSADTH